MGRSMEPMAGSWVRSGGRAIQSGDDEGDLVLYASRGLTGTIRPMPAQARAVSVDPDLCLGGGDCVRTVPGAFCIDEARNVSLPQPDGVRVASLEGLVLAARQCPTNAIRVVGDDGELLVDSG